VHAFSKQVGEVLFWASEGAAMRPYTGLSMLAVNPGRRDSFVGAAL
jgi:hypothetical protein